MTWTKLGDEFVDTADPLSDGAFRTHVEALAFSNRMLLDLLVSKRTLPRFARTDDADQAAKELVEAGWWEDRGDHWYIGLRFPDWQRDRAQVEARRQQWSAATLRKRRHASGDHSLCLPRNCPEAPREEDVSG